MPRISAIGEDYVNDKYVYAGDLNAASSTPRVQIQHPINLTTAHVIPTEGRNPGMGRTPPPQMLRRCGWLSMTLLEQ